ncbi:uncharacterized protein BXIN_1904 [Babesia sp. Xinjiang]|uniref:uncharacterized protein n=1 Tax=Babesia sp. Xinjiang TaxID=462227 RepID=UPI000A23963F|nr:uncharacterized protein BXIN_1904 [Babesia sp. Xinjiang]ORM40615.1 hypothetical protein BXIN_1904 [Babesia sp. Xinjiang]
MVTLKPSELEAVERVLKSLSVDRKLSCALVKDYAALRASPTKGHTSVFTDPAKEAALRKQIESLLEDSVEATHRLARLLENVEKGFTFDKHDLALCDILHFWKRDVALRIVLLSQLPTCDTLDLQRLLFMWLDSPYTVKLPFVND